MDKVAEANRRFYEEIAGVYDAIDSRRNSGEEHAWLEPILQDLAQKSPGPIFLDAGAGTGFLVKRARPYFSNCIAVDISPSMLEKIEDTAIQKISSPLDAIPLPAASVDCMGSFATLHHLFSPPTFFAEAYRLLRKGGTLYTDHDISAAFVEKFKFPLALYRKFFDHGKRYLQACPSANEKDYEVSEFHGEAGLDGESLRIALTQIGFSHVEVTHHWQGMGIFAALESALPEKLRNRPGNSPILRILAIK